MQRIEYATGELARRCGIAACNARLEPIRGGDVLMVERFDREYTDCGYLRFGFVSGMTLLDCDENYLDRERWSYPLLADEPRRWSVKPDEDRRELFRRIVFDAAVTNNDDHPRNHAVCRTARGWRLTLAYDLVPSPLVSLERRDLAMTIGNYGQTASTYNLLSQPERFALTTESARQEIEKMVATLRIWRVHFRACGVSAKDIEYIARRSCLNVSSSRNHRNNDGVCGSATILPGPSRKIQLTCSRWPDVSGPQASICTHLATTRAGR